MFTPGIVSAQEDCVQQDNRVPPWRADDSGFRPRPQDEPGYGVSSDAGHYGYRPRPGDITSAWRNNAETECAPRTYDPFKDRGFRPRETYGGEGSRDDVRGIYPDSAYRGRSLIDRARPGPGEPSNRQPGIDRSGQNRSIDYPGYRPPLHPDYHAYPDYYRYPDSYSSGTGNWPFSTIWDWMPMW